MMGRFEIEIEVLDGEFPASSWLDAYSERVFATAVSFGASAVDWHRHRWGIVLRLAFRDEDAFDAFRAAPAVVSALDAVPDPVKGLVFHRGWGGTSGSGEPRRPRPRTGAGAASLPIPSEHLTTRAVGRSP